MSTSWISYLVIIGVILLVHFIELAPISSVEYIIPDNLLTNESMIVNADMQKPFEFIKFVIEEDKKLNFSINALATEDLSIEQKVLTAIKAFSSLIVTLSLSIGSFVVIIHRFIRKHKKSIRELVIITRALTHAVNHEISKSEVTSLHSTNDLVNDLNKCLDHVIEFKYDGLPFQPQHIQKKIIQQPALKKEHHQLNQKINHDEQNQKVTVIEANQQNLEINSNAQNMQNYPVNNTQPCIDLNAQHSQLQLEKVIQCESYVSRLRPRTPIDK